jgi:hypothetical protein
MATRFVRIDLSDNARDFRPVALEPGLPLLDRSGSCAKILFRWLGGLVAEPVWEGESVNFFVRDDHGGRLEEVICQPATGEDLRTTLKDDLATLKSRLEKARPETPTERTLCNAVVQALQDLTADPGRSDLDCFFFRYRDVKGRWRLVWCWGYQRADQEPAPAVICTDPDCNLLFVRRRGKSPKCPSCAAALAPRPERPTAWRWAVALGLLMLLLGGGLLWWFRPGPPGVAPEKLKGLAIDQPRGERPAAVKILSDQGPAVRFPVGAEFDDFRVEAHYADGFTQIVTKKATLKTAQPPETAPAAAAGGRLRGLRPGRTAVQAEFDGVSSQQPLEVEVTAEIDVNEVRLVPTPVTMLRGETVSLDAVGYKNEKSVGVINGTGNLAWQSSNSAVAEVNGPTVTGLSLGQAAVTASLGSITSQPAEVNVVETIADPLVVDPKVIRLQAGESAQIGADVVVRRGQTDMSRQCSVTPALPSVVRFVPETRSLVGVAPGASAVALALGEKLTNVIVEVLPQSAAIEGTVVVEPSSGTLAPGQALPLRVFAVAPSGQRSDRTETAVFSSSDPAKVKVLSNRACAVVPGAARITATLPGAEKSGAAQIDVNDEQISGLLVDPARLDMSPGDLARLRILGRAPCGSYELFPQPDLTLSAGGSNPAAIRVTGGGEVTAAGPGEAEVEVAWRDRLRQQVPVAVTDSPLTDLRIEPAQAAIHPGEPLVYQATAIRGGLRRVLGPESGVSLLVGQQDVAEVIGPLAVRGNNPGRTTVAAQAGAQRAEANLEVIPGTGPGTSDVVVGAPGLVEVYGPGYGYFGDRRYWRGGKWREYRGGEGYGKYVEREPAGEAVQVVAPDRLWIQPPEIVLQVGQAMPPLMVMAQRQDEKPYEVPAALESTDPNVLAPDTEAPGRFVAKAVGQTQLRAEYRGREAFAKVTVSGSRFQQVTARLNPGKDDFSVSIEVLAAQSEGPLEYRVYAAGQSPAETWVSAQVQGDFRRAILRSPPVPYGPRGSLYHLMIEARDPSGGTIQQYPLTFGLREHIELREGGGQDRLPPQEP